MSATETHSTSRRRLLQTAASVGIGAGLVWGFGSEYATTADRAEITYALARSTRDSDSLTPRTRTVPADWFASTKTAFAVQREVRKSALSPLVASFVVPGTFSDPSATLSIDATTENVVDELDVTDGVEIDITVLDELPSKPDPPDSASDPFQISDLNSRRIPGGVQCQTPELSGTLAPCAYEAGGDRRFFVTSNHVYGGEGTKTTEHRGQPLDLQANGERRTIGRVARGFPEADFVRVSPADDAVPVSEIASDDPSTVIGQYTRIGLADRMARDEPLQKFGAFSGHSEGEILGVDGLTCYLGDVCKPGQIKWGDKRTLTGGDSGSINYAPDPEHPSEYVIAGGLNSAHSWWPGADFAWGTAGFQLRNEYGIHF